jgi:putative component of toxin-antitoxin plasmid stabilization module
MLALAIASTFKGGVRFWLLLLGGDKSTQTKDIELAIKLAESFEDKTK